MQIQTKPIIPNWALPDQQQRNAQLAELEVKLAQRQFAELYPHLANIKPVKVRVR